MKAPTELVACSFRIHCQGQRRRPFSCEGWKGLPSSKAFQDLHYHTFLSQSIFHLACFFASCKKLSCCLGNCDSVMDLFFALNGSREKLAFIQQNFSDVLNTIMNPFRLRGGRSALLRLLVRLSQGASPRALVHAGQAPPPPHRRRPHHPARRRLLPNGKNLSFKNSPRTEIEAVDCNTNPFLSFAKQHSPSAAPKSITELGQN